MSLLLGLMFAADLSWANKDAAQSMAAAKASWETCIDQRAIELAPKQASAEDVAFTALNDCRVQQQAFMESGVAVMVSGGISEQDARRRLRGEEPKLVELRRQRAIAAVVKARP